MEILSARRLRAAGDRPRNPAPRPRRPAPGPLGPAILAVALLVAAVAGDREPQLVAAAPPAAVVPEYNAKAGYLLLFTRYVEWPATSFAGADAPVVIGVLGTNRFGDVLERTVRGLKSNGRPVVVRPVDTAAEAALCHVVFLGAEDERQESAWLRSLAGRPVLTVGDRPDSLVRGAVLSFVMVEMADGPKLRFDANLVAAESAGVRISAPMLVSARHVIRRAAGGGAR